MENRLLYGFVLAFAFGIFLAWISGATLFFAIFLSLCSLALFLAYRYSRHERATFFFLLSLFFLGTSLGILRLDISKAPSSAILQQYVSQTVELVGMVSDEPDRRENNTELRIEVTEYSSSKNVHQTSSTLEKIEPNEKVLVFVSRYANIHYGDRISVVGELQRPENFEGQNGRQFNYVGYLKKDGIRYVMFYPETRKVSSGNGNYIKAQLFALKESFLANISRLVPEPEAGLLSGLLVGQKHGLGNELLSDFRKIGIIHVVVLSGYNVSLVADFIMRIFSFLPALVAGTFGGVGICLFVILSGGSTTAIRAGAMAILVIIARASGRTADALRLLFLVGLVMLLWNPKTLLFDPSFQLSFMATFGLLLFSPALSTKLSFLPEKYHVREIVAATIATQIFVLPIILFMMGNFSFVSVPINLAVLLFIPATMLVGFVAGMIGYVSIALAIPFASIAYLLLAYEIGAVTFAADIPLASFVVPHFPWFFLVFIYAMYATFFYGYKKFWKHFSASRLFNQKERDLLPGWEIVEIPFKIDR